MDDEPQIRTLLIDVLVEGGYAADSAVDGVAAVKSFVEHRPDLILLDIEIPRLRGVDTRSPRRTVWSWLTVRR